MIWLFPTFYLSLLPFSAGIKRAENLPSLVIPVCSHHWGQHMPCDQLRKRSQVWIPLFLRSLLDQVPQGDVPLSDLWRLSNSDTLLSYLRQSKLWWAQNGEQRKTFGKCQSSVLWELAKPTHSPYLFKHVNAPIKPLKLIFSSAL